ncbi:MAG: hypothetical protein ABUL49_01650, partial [bacterium]
SEQLQGQLPSMDETTRLSQGFHNAKLFPVELAHVLETGEMTGQTGRALEDARQMSQSKQQVMQAILVTKGWIWIGLILIAFTLIGFGLFQRAFYGSAFKHILDENDGGANSAGISVPSD